MNEKDIKTLYNVLYETINFNSLLGEKSGIMNELRITEQGIYAYGIFFGCNIWLKLNEKTFEWEEISEINNKD